MPCTPALSSLPVEEAQAQVVEVGTREGTGITASSSSSSSSSSMVTQDKIFGTTLAQIHLGRGDRSCDGLGTYRPTARGYATDPPAAGEKSVGLESTTEFCTKGTKGGVF